MKPKIVKANSLKEYLTPERCYIAENWGILDDKKVSIACATVKPAVTTKAHHLEGVQEIYIITTGTGKIYVGDLEPAKVVKGDVVVIPVGTIQRISNIGKTDLVFYCICIPAFTAKCYHNDEK